MDIAVGIFVGLAVLILFFAYFQALDLRQSRERIRYIKHYSPMDKSQSQYNQSDFGFSLKASANRKLVDRGSYRKLPALGSMRVKLRRAGVKLSLKSFLALIIGAIVSLSFLLYLIVPFYPVALFLSMVITYSSARFFLNRNSRKSRESFEEGLPDFLIVLASSLRSGLPLIQSLESISHRGDGEVEREMRQATGDIALGLDPSSALLEVAKRMGSIDMSWVVLAIAIQREVGGSLSTILESVAETVQQRARVQREVRTLSAESRLSAIVLVGLPIAVFIFFYFTRREYVSIFWTTSYGLVLSVLMVSLAGIGTLWMRHIVRIKV